MTASSLSAEGNPTPFVHRWVGGAAMWPGVGVFIGHTGDNQQHHHWAHQLVIGLDGDVELSADAVSTCAPALFVTAGTQHRLTPANVLLVFFDPTTALARAFCQRLADTRPRHRAADADTFEPVPPGLTALLRDCLTDPADLTTAAARLHAGLMPDQHTPDPRIHKVLAAIMPGTEPEQRLNRRQLAALAGLSETRFSHWFKEATGMPLRSYRKWLNLVHGLEHALHGQNLTTAAYQAEFADQAHFSRTFSQMFGVSASDVLAQVSLLAETNQPHRTPSAKVTSIPPMSFFDGRSR